MKTDSLADLDFSLLRPPPLFPAVPEHPSCGKRTYSKRDALRVRNLRLRRGPRRHRPAFLRIYFCAACQGWHLTHTPPLDT